MTQASPWKNSTLSVVNVASVPQLSPFRYPGGKTWFVPHALRWLSSLERRPHTFLEPFAGGASVSCAVLSKGMADRVHLVELDEDVVAVWQTVFSEQASKLAECILEFILEREKVLDTLAQPPKTPLERAFQTILRNRVQRGGILAPGAGLIKAGENGKGLSSRWYPETLARRIQILSQWREQVTVTHGDGLQTLEQNLERSDVATFLDPPYTAGGKGAGSRLYRHHTLEHDRLFEQATALKGDFVMTYDPAPEVLQRVGQFGLCTRAIAMKNTHHTVQNEQVIGKNLDWL